MLTAQHARPILADTHVWDSPYKGVDDHAQYCTGVKIGQLLTAVQGYPQHAGMLTATKITDYSYFMTVTVISTYTATSTVTTLRQWRRCGALYPHLESERPQNSWCVAAGTLGAAVPRK